MAPLGCARTGADDDSQPETETPVLEQPQAENGFWTLGQSGAGGRFAHDRFPREVMAEVAQLLDIDQQQLEDASDYARSEMQGTTVD